MKFGFIGSEGGTSYRAALDEVRLAEQAGLDSVWLEEHHLDQEHYWGTPLLGLAGYASATERISLGSNVIVLPFYHLTRLAEEAHFLSIMSEGRFVLGIGMGYRDDEYRAYGVSKEGVGRRYGEAMRLLRRLLTEEHVVHEGETFRVDDLTIAPKSPHGVPLWAGGWGEQNLRRAARYADVWIPGPTADLAKLEACRATYERCRVEAGRPANTDERPLTRELVIGESDGQAFELAERCLLPSYRDEYSTWSHPLVGGQTKLASDLAAIGADRFVIGSPDRVVETIRMYADRLDVNHFIFRVSSRTTSHQHVIRQLELLGEHVIPAFAPRPN